MSRKTREQATREKRFREGLACLAIEGTSLHPDDLNMLTMFERENWSDERRMAHIRAHFSEVEDGSLAAE